MVNLQLVLVAHLPDLNLSGFFLFKDMKALVYVSSVDSAEDFVARIVVAAIEINRIPEISE